MGLTTGANWAVFGHVDSRRLQSADQAAKIILAYEGWFGPPAIEWEGRLVDGVTRLLAWQRLGYGARAPIHRPESARHCARALYHAGEYLKLASMFEESLSLRANSATERSELAATLMLSDAHELVATLQGRVRARGARMAMLKRNTTRKRPAIAVRAMVQEYYRAVETGRAVSMARLAELLAPWLR